MLTGESQPVEKGESDEVIGGAVNGEGAITIEVRRTGADTYLSQVIELVRKAQEDTFPHSGSRRPRGPLAHAHCHRRRTVTFVAWLGAGREFKLRARAHGDVMVITCPHALGLAVPLVVAVSTALSRETSADPRPLAFERARALDAVVFDKTGTSPKVASALPTSCRSTAHRARRPAPRRRAREPLRAPHRRRNRAAATERGVQYPAPDGFRRHSGEGRLGSGGRRGGKGREPRLPQESRAWLSRTRASPGSPNRGKRSVRAAAERRSELSRWPTSSGRSPGRRWPGSGDGHQGRSCSRATPGA